MSAEFATHYATAQASLKARLQSAHSRVLERLAAALFSRLLGLPIAVAKSGFQFGGDAGPAGRENRHFRLEAKRYADNTDLDTRELLGEIDQALAQDPALEAWVLVATRTVPEQLQKALRDKGEQSGAPVLILEWRDDSLAELAALCAFAPDLVDSQLSPAAGNDARVLSEICQPSVEAIRRELATWELGFAGLRAKSHARLLETWNEPARALAWLGQDVAGGAISKKVRRQAAFQRLQGWWDGPSGAPALVLGWDGVGKTWATLDWLVTACEALPIVLIAPSGSAADLRAVSPTVLKAFLAERLHELNPRRDRVYWLRRLERLLERPADDGPVITLFLDGLSQEPSVDWPQVFRALQSPELQGRVRVVGSTRNYHFEQKLGRLRGLILPPVAIEVGSYGAEPGGEFDQMLAFENLTRDELAPDLITLARNPRLFSLVLRFRNRLVDAGQVTVHRLLWEYGRDTLGRRAGRSFSEEDWRDWLREIATRARDGVVAYTRAQLSETASRPDLGNSEVYARLSDIIDNQFASRDAAGVLRLLPRVVDHALGAALLDHLTTSAPAGFDEAEVVLVKWLDPIGALDQRAEVLRAAISILVESGASPASPVAGALVTAWLQSQNISDDHRRELTALAATLCPALLDAAEHSGAPSQRSALIWATNALRAIPRDELKAMALIVARLTRALRVVSREAASRARHSDLDRHRSERLMDRIGVDAAGAVTVAGVAVELVDDTDRPLSSAAASILEAFPLAGAIDVFEAAAIAQAITAQETCWDGLKWLCLLNDNDPAETADALRRRAAEIAARPAEPGINPGLPRRIASLLLWLTGYEADEIATDDIDPGLDHLLTYERDYLPDPARSRFRLERRHATQVLQDPSLPLHTKIRRLGDLWFDPDVEFPPQLRADVIAALDQIDPGALQCHVSASPEDHWFEELEPVAARLAPEALAAFYRKRAATFATAPAQSRYWKAFHVLHGFLLLDDDAAAGAGALRRRSRETHRGNEAAASTYLLIVEIAGRSALDQIAAIIDADLTYILTEVETVLRSPTATEVEALIERYGAGEAKQRRDLLTLLSIVPRNLGDVGWHWVESWLDSNDEDALGLAFQALARADEAHFGRVLLERGWGWDAQHNLLVNHYGSGALIAASLGRPFEQVADRLAPWRLFEAARTRGGEAPDARLAAEIFDAVLRNDAQEAPDPGSDLTMDLTQRDGALATLSIRLHQDGAELEGLAGLAQALDAEGRQAALHRAANTAVDRINAARRLGASLYLLNVDADDFETVLRQAPDYVERWIQGFDDGSRDFARRVRLAEGAYLALCEALLRVQPETGVKLWRALGAAMTTRFTGAAGIDERTLIALRAPASAPVDQLRRELLSLESAPTDAALFDVAVAAALSGVDAWFAGQFRPELDANSNWRRKRAIVLSGFTTANELPEPAAWPDGQARSSFDDLLRAAARRRWSEACARYWWDKFIAAETPETAFAAWVLFKGVCDARAWSWVKASFAERGLDFPDNERKLSHVRLNRDQLKRAMDKSAKGDEGKLFGRSTVDGVGPWGKAR